MIQCPAGINGELDANPGIRKQRLGKISKQGDQYLRWLLVSQRDPMMWLCYVGRATANIRLGEYDSAMDCCRKGMQLPNATYLLPLNLVFALTKLGQFEDARKAGTDIIRFKSDFTLAFARIHYGIQEDKMEEYIEALRGAGIPEI